MCFPYFRYVQFFATKPSPTEHILDLWEARHREESAITDLMNIFRVMGRGDAALVLEKDSGAWLWKIIRNWQKRSKLSLSLMFIDRMSFNAILVDWTVNILRPSYDRCRFHSTANDTNSFGDCDSGSGLIWNITVVWVWSCVIWFYLYKLLFEYVT